MVCPYKERDRCKIYRKCKGDRLNMWQTWLYGERNHMIHTQHRKEASEYIKAQYIVCHMSK